MARKRRRKKRSLYEVIGTTVSKSGHDKTLEQLPPEETVDEPIAAELTSQVPERLVRWPTRPRMVQFNAGRIELSIPYPIAITLLLGVILLVLIAFRLGQIALMSSQKMPDSAREIRRIDESKPVGRRGGALQAAAATEEIPLDVPASGEETEPVNPKANNVIVLVEYQARADLVPVQGHFAEYGIETKIIRENDRYFLITKNRYENPKKPGTDGYEAKQRIIRVGATYKAPPGYETFAPHLFSDAYGKKVR